MKRSNLVTIGIDPGSSYLGLGATRIFGGETFECISLCRIRTQGKDLGEILEAVEKIWNPILAKEKGTILLSVEKPPAAYRSDARHGRQTPIGWKLGIIAGALMGPFSKKGSGVIVREVEVDFWRTRIMSWSAQKGFPLSRPSRRSLSEKITPQNKMIGFDRILRCQSLRKWEALYRCGHQFPLAGFQDLKNVPPECPSCRKNTELADSVRDAWKQLACSIVEFHYPAAFARVVDEARRKARKAEKQPYQLEGVADACESLCISIASALPDSMG